MLFDKVDIVVTKAFVVVSFIVAGTYANCIAVVAASGVAAAVVPSRALGTIPYRIVLIWCGTVRYRTCS